MLGDVDPLTDRHSFFFHPFIALEIESLVSACVDVRTVGPTGSRNRIFRLGTVGYHVSEDVRYKPDLRMMNETGARAFENFEAIRSHDSHHDDLRLQPLDYSSKVRHTAVAENLHMLQ